MTFAHDWHLEWIISHGGSFIQPSLCESHIVHDIWIDHTLDAEGYPLHASEEEYTWDETFGTLGE